MVRLAFLVVESLYYSDLFSLRLFWHRSPLSCMAMFYSHLLVVMCIFNILSYNLCTLLKWKKTDKWFLPRLQSRNKANWGRHTYIYREYFPQMPVLLSVMFVTNCLSIKYLVLAVLSSVAFLVEEFRTRLNLGTVLKAWGICQSHVWIQCNGCIFILV